MSFITSRRVAAAPLVLLLFACFQLRLAHAWSPTHYRMTTYGNRNVNTRTWIQFAEVELYASAVKQSVSSVALTRGTHVSNDAVGRVVDGNTGTDFTGDLQKSGRVLILTFTLSSGAWIDSYKVRTSASAPADRDPKQWSLSASADGSTFYPVHFVPDGALAASPRGAIKTFTVPPSMTLFRLDVTAVRNGGTEVEFSEFRALSSSSAVLASLGGTGLGESYNADTSTNTGAWPKTSTPVYTGPWQAADGDTSTVARQTGALGSLYVAYDATSVPMHAVCKYALVTGTGSNGFDPVSWTLKKIYGVSSVGQSPTEAIVDTKSNVNAPTARSTSSPEMSTGLCECACMGQLGFQV